MQNVFIFFVKTISFVFLCAQNLSRKKKLYSNSSTNTKKMDNTPIVATLGRGIFQGAGHNKTAWF